jgi:hypothetical protein
MIMCMFMCMLVDFLTRIRVVHEHFMIINIDVLLNVGMLLHCDASFLYHQCAFFDAFDDVNQ